MTTLTLYQPWASAMFIPRPDALAQMLKGFETRGFRPTERMLKPGDRLAIHSGKADNEELRDWWMSRVKNTVYGAAFAATGLYNWTDLPFGKVIGNGIFVGAFPTETLLANDAVDVIEQHWGNYGPGRFGWQMQQMVQLPLPVPCRGRQSLFDWQG